MAVRCCIWFALLVLFVSFNKNVSLTHDQKVDIIKEAYESLTGLVRTLLQVHGAIVDGENNADGDLQNLTNSEARSTFEVEIMKADHQAMLAEAAKRSDISEEELKDATERGNKINEAESNLATLRQSIQDATNNVSEINTKMQTTTLKAQDLTDLQEQANAVKEIGNDTITMPSTAEIRERVNEQLENMRNVTSTVTDIPIKNEGERLIRLIETDFGVLLKDGTDATPVKQLKTTANQIDTFLLQFKQLDMYGSASRMEL